ncbi:hypothetical protein HPB48_005701 [Haemaphysalis longicornis]|uniref:Fibronectin type-III domain-containing protein n=1 Tax=Haemaphysalis longicornis TaxID=44386 RepID=A0A9J6H1P7_HAELO|nr:hypothetical protein HPB48_005701 [Haemaphysalis longicornis]
MWFPAFIAFFFVSCSSLFFPVQKKPAAPQNVSLVKRTTTTLTYVWPISANANRSKVEVRDLNESAVKQDSPKVDCESDNEKQHICNITSLTPGCHYEVSLQNCAEYCGVKRVLHDHTQVSAPSAVRNFKPSIANFVNATFYWAKPEFPNGPIDGYLIEIYNKDTKRTQSCLAGGPAVSHTVDLKEEFTYFSGKIRAYNLNLVEHRTLLGPETTINFESLGEARDLAPRNVFVLTKTDICLHSLGIDPANVKANVFWKAPRIVESPIVAYAIHVITETGYDITIRVDSTITEYPVDIFQCWEVYMVRVEAVFESGESAVSAATVVHVTDEITVSTTLGKREFYSLAPADTTFLYDNLSSNATTSFGVSARTILDVGPTAHSHVNFTFPPAYVTWSRENKGESSVYEESHCQNLHS